jgi:hypothetical protein
VVMDYIGFATTSVCVVLIISLCPQIRSLRHSNLNTVLGACVEPNHICIVSVYCSKGSLLDVLQNDNIRLDRIFKTSFASDIAQVMERKYKNSLFSS